MNVLKFLTRDIRLGILRKWYILVLPIIFAVAQTLQCNKLIEYFVQENFMRSDGTIMDYLLYAMQGMPIYYFNPHSSFMIPIEWFVFQIGISYFVAYYASSDLKQNGRNLFLASRSRLNWWTGKCLWCLCSVIVYFLVTVLSIFVTSYLMGADISCNFTNEFACRVFDQNMLYVSSKDIILIGILLPFVMTFAIGIIQLLLGLLISPVVSFATICAEYILSAYYTEWFMIGNFTMWIRSSYVNEDGLSPISGLLVAAFIIICSYVGGRYYFTNKDIM